LARHHDGPGALPKGVSGAGSAAGQREDLGVALFRVGRRGGARRGETALAVLVGRLDMRVYREQAVLVFPAAEIIALRVDDEQVLHRVMREAHMVRRMRVVMGGTAVIAIDAARQQRRQLAQRPQIEVLANLLDSLR
jgi:hypothetical protein